MHSWYTLITLLKVPTHPQSPITSASTASGSAFNSKMAAHACCPQHSFQCYRIGSIINGQFQCKMFLLIQCAAITGKPRYISFRFLNSIISCGHTTHFCLGKTDLPRVNSLKISWGKFISGFVLPRWKILGRSHYWYRLPRFSHQLNFLERKFKKARCAGI